MPENITINGIELSPRAISIIECLQDEDSRGLREQKETLSLLLVEVVQLNVGGDNWTRFAKVLADQLDFMNCLQT